MIPRTGRPVAMPGGDNHQPHEQQSITAFALALKQSRLRPIDFCRAVEKLAGQKYLPVMPSRWIQGVHDAPPPAIALAILLGQLPEEERKALIQGPPRKKYTHRGKDEAAPGGASTNS